MINIAEVYSNGVLCLQLDWLVYHEFILIKRRARDFVGSVQSHNQNINDKGIELEGERGKL